MKRMFGFSAAASKLLKRTASGSEMS